MVTAQRKETQPTFSTQPQAQWQVLTHSRLRKRTDVYIRTEACGRINFSIAAYRLLGSPKEIEILLDRANGRIGFRPATTDNRAWRVNLSVPSTASINCARVLRMLNLHVRSFTFPATMQSGTLVIDIQTDSFPSLLI